MANTIVHSSAAGNVQRAVALRAVAHVEGAAVVPQRRTAGHVHGADAMVRYHRARVMTDESTGTGDSTSIGDGQRSGGEITAHVECIRIGPVGIRPVDEGRADAGAACSVEARAIAHVTLSPVTLPPAVIPSDPVPR